MANKLIIAVGTANYDNMPHLCLPGLEKVVDSIADLFTQKLGYSRALEEISGDPTSDQLKKGVDDWLIRKERDDSDWLVFYYTGHGELVVPDKLYLLTRDYKSNQTTTAVSVEDFGSMLVSKGPTGENRKVKHCLLILDTCHSGAGVLGLSREIGKWFAEGARSGMFYVLAAAFPRQEAMAGCLAKALIQSIEDESLAGVQQRLIYFDQLIPAINRRLRTHKVMYSIVAAPDEEPQFFPNPRYLKDVPPAATVDEIRRAAVSREVEGFWGPTSRGVESELQSGWYFTGRERALIELSQWLNDPDDSRTRVVTGGPGSGKSAVLAKIITLSDPKYRQRMLKQDASWSEAFPVNSIDLAVHAKGKTFREITERVATALGVAGGLDNVLAALKSREQPFNFVLDALDEARESDRIACDLLAPLHSVFCVNLLVGTRPEYVDKLGENVVQLHLDHPEYFEKRDLAKYVTMRLLGQGQDNFKTPYDGQAGLANRVGDAVADKAYPNFLIGRLVAEDLLSRKASLHPDEIAQIEFPASVGRAFEQYLARFNADEQKARDLLAPLAWAEGLGLPWSNIWPAVASALSTRSYREEDVGWILEQAGSFVVESLEDDRSVYRLYHQALADYLRLGREISKTQQLITTAIIWTVPVLADDSGTDWHMAHSYIRSHLADHAAVCGMLPMLIKDPLFLLSAHPDRLRSVMDHYPKEIPRDIAHVYQSSLHQLKNKPFSEAASYLEMAARKSLLTEFAERVSKLSKRSEWNVPWARWRAISTHRILAEYSAPVVVLAVAKRQGRTVIVAGSDDGSIHISDLARGESIGTPLIGHTSAVSSLVIAELQGRSVIVSGSEDTSIRIWDLERCEAIGPPLTGNEHTHPVTALAVSKRQGRTVVISGSYNRIQIWDLDRGETVGDSITGHPSGLTSLVVTERHGRTVIVSGSANGSIYISDLENNGAGVLLTKDTSGVMALTVAPWQGGIAIISGNSDGSIQVRDLEQGELIGPPLIGHIAAVWGLEIAQHEGHRVIISGSDDKTIRIWDMVHNSQLGTPLVGHTFAVRALAVAEDQGRLVIVSGSYDSSIRVWDLKREKEVCDPLNHDTFGRMALAVGERKGRSAVISGSTDGGIRIWDVESGEAVGGLPILHPPSVTALAVAKGHGKSLLFSGGADTHIRIWDLERGEAVGTPLKGHTGSVKLLATVEQRGHDIIVSASSDNTIRIWDRERGDEVDAPLTNSSSSITALAVVKQEGKDLIIYGGYGSIYIWNLEQSAEPVPLIRNIFGIKALSLGMRQGRNVIVCGTELTVRIWDLEQGQEMPGPLMQRVSVITALTIAGVEKDRSVLVAGGADKRIQMWDMESFDFMGAIDVGARVDTVVFAPPSTIIAGTEEGLIAICLPALSPKLRSATPDACVRTDGDQTICLSPLVAFPKSATDSDV